MTTIAVKIYHLQAGWSRLLMLADYLKSRASPTIIHVVIAEGFTLNQRLLSAANTLFIDRKLAFEPSLEQCMDMLKQRYHITQVTLHSEERSLFAALRVLLSHLPASLMQHDFHLHLYDSHPAQATARKQWLSQPCDTQQRQLNLEEAQLRFWLRHPHLAVSYQGKLCSHLVWQRLFTTHRYWLVDRIAGTQPVPEEIAPTINPLTLATAAPLSAAERMMLCQLLNIDKPVLARLLDPHISLQWQLDEQTTAWYNPLKALQAQPRTADCLQVVLSCAANLKRIYADEHHIVLPWWISPEVTALLAREQPHARSATRAEPWVIIMDASMGDLLFLLGCLPAFRARHRGEIVIVTLPAWHALAERCPLVDGVLSLDAVEEYADVLNGAIEQQQLIQSIDWRVVTAPEHMQSAMSKRLRTPYSVSQQQLILSRNTNEQQKVADFIHQHQLQQSKVVLLHPNQGALNRTWPQALWLALSEHFLQAGWQVVIIGSNHNKYKSRTVPHWQNPRIINAIDLFTSTESIALMDACDLLVATDSGPVAMAAASNIAICALYSLIPGQYRIPLRYGQAGWNAGVIDVGCEYGQCGGAFLDEKFHQLAGVAPLPTEKLGEAFGEWCPNRDKYRCLHTFDAGQFWLAITQFLASPHYVPPAQRPAPVLAAP